MATGGQNETAPVEKMIELVKGFSTVMMVTHVDDCCIRSRYVLVEKSLISYFNNT